MTDSNTYYGDYSKWNGACPKDVPWPILCFRADSGVATDSEAVNYLKLFKAKPHIVMAIAYVVFKPGQNTEILSRLKKLFGATPPAKVAFRIDDESGPDFAGPGDHSTELNELVALLQAYEHSALPVDGYANAGDWAGTWPAHPATLKRAVARYSATPPTGPFYSWQYSDGSGKYPVAAGFPAPKGLDMNVIFKTVDKILVDYGFAPKPQPVTEFVLDAEAKAAFAALNTKIDNLRALDGFDANGDGHADYTGTVQGIVAAALKPLAASLATIEANLAQKPAA